MQTAVSNSKVIGCANCSINTSCSLSLRPQVSDRSCQTLPHQAEHPFPRLSLSVITSSCQIHTLELSFHLQGSLHALWWGSSPRGSQQEKPVIPCLKPIPAGRSGAWVQLALCFQSIAHSFGHTGWEGKRKRGNFSLLNFSYMVVTASEAKKSFLPSLACSPPPPIWLFPLPFLSSFPGKESLALLYTGQFH